jgi:cytochrome P450
MEHARSLIFDYVLPSLDTTIYSTGEMLHGLATTPGAFEKVCANPELIPGVINESVRLASPLRGFTRFVQEDFKLSESTLPAGSRVWILIASANRDERKYRDPDYFDVERNPRDHVGWGHGIHLCTGMHLARLEMEVILEALVKRVRSMEAGAPTRIINNAAQGYATLPLRLHSA